MRPEESASHLVKPSQPHVGAVAGGPTRGQRSGGIWVSSVFNMPPRAPQIAQCSVLFSSASHYYYYYNYYYWVLEKIK